MENALYDFLFTRWVVSETSLVRCACSFVFWYCSTREWKSYARIFLGVISICPNIWHSTFSLFALFFTLRSTDINRQDNSGKTPLHTAILSNQFSIVTKLLASGADVTITDDAGDSVMHTAIRVGSETLVQVGRPSNRTLDPAMLQSWSRKYRA